MTSSMRRHSSAKASTATRPCRIWPRACDRSTGVADVSAAIAESSRAALDAMWTTPRELAGAACSAPGPLNHLSGIVYDAPNINGFADVHLAEGLAKALGIDAVFLDRDTVMAAIGEGVAGAARGVRDFVYVTISTGIVGGLVIGGRMLCA